VECKIYDTDVIEKSVWHILKAVGEDPARDGLLDTPRRVAKTYVLELLSGYQQDPAEVFRTFDVAYDEMVIVKDIPLYSMCEHHMLPFIGVAHIGYVPNGRVVGLSKIARIVDIFARRLQVQERLTSEVADTLVAGLSPLGVAIVIEAEHLCMTMRGVQKPGSRTVTSAMRGVFLEKNNNARHEFLRLVGR
jgi:GTP cyclohydrolase I